jgi:type VI protein secretion system component VasK
MSDADEKGKKAKKGDAKPLTVSIANHPRAKAGIRRARTRAAFIAFVLVLVLNLLGDQEPFDAILRALVAGIVVNVIAWRCAIVVWRHIVVAELREEEERRAERVREQREKLEARAAEQAAEQQANSPGFRAA